MDSIELTRELYKSGYLSKEAAVNVLRERDKLVKEALFEESCIFFKEAGILSFFRKLHVPEKAAPNSSFFTKLRTGGKTPVKEPAGFTPTNTKPFPSSSPGWSDVGANLTKILALAGLTSASAAGISAVSQHRRDKKLEAEITKSYSAMKKEYPRLREMDQGRVRNHFGVLARYAPSLAANATVAGAFVATQVQRGLIDPSMVKTLAEAQSKIDQVRGTHPGGLPFSNATSLAQSAMIGGGGG